MKRLLLAVVASAGLMLSAGAYAQTWNGPELGIQGGYGWGTSQGQAVPLAAPYNFNPDGGMGGGHAGFNWQFGPYVLGIEGDAEGGDISGSERGFAGRSVSTDMDFDASVRGKLGFAFNRVLLYGTGGVAFGNVDMQYTNAAGAPAGSDTSLRVGWTAGGGLAYAFTPNWSANVEYRYTDLGSNTFTNTAVGFHDTNYLNYNMVRVGLTYRFAPPPPPPPMMAAPMPAAAPAPPPPQPPRTFLVFFDFDKYNLTPDARQVIDAAAQSYKANGSARLEVSGYTDLAGTQAYNLRLSQRRADAVANYLLRQGVPKNVMDVKWFGKEHPRVPTPDGVREPQNRRVEIVMP